MTHETTVAGAALSPEGRRLAVFGGNSVSLWDIPSGRRVCEPMRHPLTVSLSQFSPDGSLLVTACQDQQLSQGDARIWNALTGSPIGRPLVHRDGILCATFSRDGRRIITGSEDFTAVVWDVVTGNPTGSPLHHNNHVNGVAFSPDGLRVATASADRTARVWDALTGEPLTPPLKHPTVLQYAGFASDGSKLITADKKGHIWSWDLQPDHRSIEDFLLLSQLVTGFQRSFSNLPNPRTTEERQREWRRLRYAYPNDFTTSQEQVFAWHSRYARASQSERHWAAAVFHLNHLVRLSSHDAALSDQLKQAQKFLSEEERR